MKSSQIKTPSRFFWPDTSFFSNVINLLLWNESFSRNFGLVLTNLYGVHSFHGKIWVLLLCYQRQKTFFTGMIVYPSESFYTDEIVNGFLTSKHLNLSLQHGKNQCNRFHVKSSCMSGLACWLNLWVLLTTVAVWRHSAPNTLKVFSRGFRIFRQIQ